MVISETEYQAEKIAERIEDEFLITGPVDWAVVHEQAERLREIAARELRNRKPEEA